MLEKTIIIIPNPNQYISQEVKDKGYLDLEDVIQVTQGISMDLAFNPQVKTVKPQGLSYVEKFLEQGQIDSYTFTLEITRNNDEVVPLQIHLNFPKNIKEQD